MRVMSYNTEYRGYPSRIWNFANKIKEVNAAIVGTQECQDWSGLERAASGYTAVHPSNGQCVGNYILYKPDVVTFVPGSGGWMRIPRDNYATRCIVWAKFNFNGTNICFFDTHLPHNHNEASSRNTHARIARSLLRKKTELGCENLPMVLTGDMNTHASRGASEGTLQSNLENAGWHLSYQVRGHPGYPNIDQIFASSRWTSSNGRDRGTGSSDHAAISVDLTLKR